MGVKMNDFKSKSWNNHYSRELIQYWGGRGGRVHEISTWYKLIYTAEGKLKPTFY